jgi:hypothetical protein
MDISEETIDAVRCALAPVQSITEHVYATGDGRRLVAVADGYTLCDVSESHVVPRHTFKDYESAKSWLDEHAVEDRVEVFVAREKTVIVVYDNYESWRNPTMVVVEHGYAASSREWLAKLAPERIGQADLHRLLVISPEVVESTIAQKLLALASKMEVRGAAVATSQRDAIGGNVSVNVSQGQTIEVAIPPKIELHLTVERPASMDVLLPVLFRVHADGITLEEWEGSEAVLAKRAFERAVFAFEGCRVLRGAPVFARNTGTGQ